MNFVKGMVNFGVWHILGVEARNICSRKFRQQHAKVTLTQDSEVDTSMSHSQDSPFLRSLKLHQHHHTFKLCLTDLEPNLMFSTFAYELQGRRSSINFELPWIRGSKLPELCSILLPARVDEKRVEVKKTHQKQRFKHEKVSNSFLCSGFNPNFFFFFYDDSKMRMFCVCAWVRDCYTFVDVWTIVCVSVSCCLLWVIVRENESVGWNSGEKLELSVKGDGWKNSVNWKNWTSEWWIVMMIL